MKKRPLLRYHGGKWNLAKWIISHFPPHRIYVEPYGGAASVLLQKSRCYSETYNDMDGEICNLFRQVRENGQELIRLIDLTPFSREEFKLSYEKSDDQLEQARRTLVRSFLGFGSGAASGENTGFRGKSNRSGTTGATDWMHYPDNLRWIIERLRGVAIENRPAMDLIDHHDSSETLFYFDPTYVLSTRSANNARGNAAGVYRFEMTDQDHITFLQKVMELKGMVVISGYKSQIYSDNLPGFKMVDKPARGDGGCKRTEALWLSPNIPNVQLKAF